jgi:hypothetical protein
MPCARKLEWLDAGYVRVRRPIVLVRGAVTESTPKTKTGDRLIWLDTETVRILKEHRTTHLKARLMAEADGNRTRQRRGTPLSGFEDQGNHQESRRLRPRLY